MNGKSKSILLQVAFKEAVSSAATQGLFDMVSIADKTQDLFNVLLSLHEKNGIDADDAPKARSGGNRGGSRPTTPKPSGEIFTFNNILVEDFRGAKADPALGLKPNYPDFKTVNGDVIDGVTTDSGAAWLYDQDGNANEAVQALVAAADTKVF